MGNRFNIHKFYILPRQHLCFTLFSEQRLFPYTALTKADCFFTTERDCVDKKNQLNITFCILYFSSYSCSTCFGQPCAHHQELTTA